MDVQEHLYRYSKKKLKRVAEVDGAMTLMLTIDAMNDALVDSYTKSERQQIYNYLTGQVGEHSVPVRIRRQAEAIREVIETIERFAAAEHPRTRRWEPGILSAISLVAAGLFLILLLPELLMPVASEYATGRGIGKVIQLTYMGYVLVPLGLYVGGVVSKRWWDDFVSDRHLRFFLKLGKKWKRRNGSSG